MADLPRIPDIQGEIQNVTIINPHQTQQQFKEYKPEYVLITHAIVPLILQTDPIRGLCQQHRINLWCRLLTKPLIRFPRNAVNIDISRTPPIPFERAIFFVTQQDWQKLKRVTEEISIYIDGRCNIGLWERLQLSEIADLNLKPAHISVLGLCDDSRYLKPISDNNQITFIQTEPHPYAGAIAAKHTELKESIIEQLKDYKPH